MSSVQIVLSDNKTEFIKNFNPHLTFSKPHEMALVNLETYYSFPNIYEANNVFRYSRDGGTTWEKVRIPKGSYDLVDINNVLKSYMREKKQYDEANDEYPIKISANFNTLKTLLFIDRGYIVDFGGSSSIASVLGFKRKRYAEGYHQSEEIVNILSINSILVNIDVIKGSYVNGVKSNTIYSFFPNVAPGYKIIEKPTFPLYLPLILNDIHSIRVKLTDQDGTLLDLRNENVTIRFHIREIK